MLRFVLVLIAVSLSYQTSDRCNEVLFEIGVSFRYNETVAHAIHSFTMEELQKFNADVTEDNGVPVVNPKLNDPKTTERVIDNAPSEKIGIDFHGETMNVIDQILTNIGTSSDGLGPNWYPLERVVHRFHMRDLWAKLLPIYQEIVKEMTFSFGADAKLASEACACLTDVKKNGIFDAVDWIARHYKTGTPITLLNRPIPKLKDASSWKIWKDRLLHYYDKDALTDAAVYLACALN